MKKFGLNAVGIRRALNRCGWDLHRLNIASDISLRLLRALEYSGVSLVFDVGANVGQFALMLRSRGFTGDIVSFEPLSAAHDVLQKAAISDSRWHIYPRVAIGNSDGEVQINISQNSVSSSILPMLERHLSAAESSGYVAHETVPIARLDALVPVYAPPETGIFVKIDTQGYEWQVLDGAPETLRRAKGVLIELSLVPLYEGQRLWREIVDRLEAEGFVLWALQNGFTDTKNGRSLQVDAIFLRSGDHQDDVVG